MAKKRKSYQGQGALALAQSLGIPTGVEAQGGVSSGKKSSRGRGRPSGTFKYYVPGVGKVPIDVYKKYITQQKAQLRYQAEIEKVKRYAAPVPPDHTGRGYPGEFAYADEPDMDMGGQAMPYPDEQAPQGPPKPNVFQRLQALAAQKRMQRQMGGVQGQPGQPSLMQPSQSRITLMQGQPRAPRMNVWGGPQGTQSDNILSNPNIFNNPGQTEIMP